MIFNKVKHQSFSKRPEKVILNSSTKEPVHYFNSNECVKVPTHPQFTKQEFRGVWACTIWNLDFPQHTNEQSYKDSFLELLDNLANYNMNCLLFQIRPKNDAFYESKLNPWSRFLTGTEGVHPGWNPLPWMIEETHKRGIEFHAWFNPYRVFVKDVSPLNIVSLHPEYVLKLKPGEEILNPGIPAVQQFIIDTVVEVAQNYDIDGVHFDDYFYPYGGLEASYDEKEYQLYNHSHLSLDDWRRENVNYVIKTIQSELKRINNQNHKAIVLGMSPFAIWRNKTTHPLGSNTKSGVESYSELYADAYRWVKEEWIDYIVPQTYFEFTNQNAPYADLVDWWVDLVKGTNVNLYTGQSIYRYKEGGWRSGPWENPNELYDQLLYNSKYEEVTGSVYFRSNYFKTIGPENLTFAQNQLKELFQYPVLPPVYKNIQVHAVNKPKNLKAIKNDKGILLSWKSDKHAKAYYIYRYEQAEKVLLERSKVIAIVKGSNENELSYFDQIDSNATYQYIVTSFDFANKESKPSKIIIR